MEKGCKKINLLEKKVNVIIILFCIIICYIIIRLCYINWNSFIDLFENSNGDFDNSIMWSAISAIGTILAFLGVIITILYTEKSRIKQNEFEYQKEKLLVKQNEFEEYLRRIEQTFDSSQLAQEIIRFDGSNISEINKMAFNYISKLYNVESNINWFFDDEIFSGSAYMEVLKEIQNYRKEMKENIDELNKIIQNFYLQKSKFIQEAIDIGIIKDMAINTKVDSEVIKTNEKIFDISKKIIEYRNLHLPVLNNLLRNCALERQNKVKEKLNIMK